MKVCDRHNRKPATEVVTVQSLDSKFDLCLECANQILEFMRDTGKDTVADKPKRNILGLMKRDSA